MKIINNYEGSAIDIVKNDLKKNTLYLSLKKENDKYAYYYNFCIANDSKESGKIYIENITKSDYYTKDYNSIPYIRKKNEEWKKLNESRVKLKNDKIEIEIFPNDNFEISLVPRYTKENLDKFLESIKNNKNVNIKNEILTQVEIGNQNLPTVIVIGRQHPGETLSSFFIEEMIKSILDNETFLKKYYFVFFPIVNQLGVKNGNHRYANNIDYNRSWNKENPPKEIKFIKEQMKSYNIKFFIDVHNDEITNQDYIRINRNIKKNRIADILVLKRVNPVKRWLRALIKQRKIINLKNKTALEYIANKYKCETVLIELSMKQDYKKIQEKGKNFISEFMED